VSRLERAAGTETFALRGTAGYRSLARHAKVELATVLRHAENGTLRALVETRGSTAERTIQQRTTARIAYLYRLRELGARVPE
jgi:hypothetical protein